MNDKKNNMSEPKADIKVDRLRKALSALDKMQSKLSSIESKETEPIAIVGMSCRLPGFADTPEVFWKNLIAEIDTITEIPESRWDVNDYYDETQGVPGKMYTRYGAFIDKVDEFDAGFFGISPREATMMDPQQRLLLESTWEALENASIVPGKTLSKNTGVFVGVMSHDYSQLTNDPEIIDVHTGSGNIVSVIAGRLSYLLGLQGPTLTVDTACSSSLVAAHLASQSLRLGECDTAIVGGVNLILTPIGNIVECSAKMLSVDGHCKTFDDKADGFVRGEGCGAVILKRLSDAQKDNDQIIAVIRGSGVNHVGKSSGLTVPSGHAQNDVITRALNNGKVNAGEIDYVEAHGTGTSLGDPVEVESLAYSYAKERNKSNPLIIGSVKTNIGHLEGAAGIVGLMKVALSLKNKILPAHLNFSTPNKNIPWDRCAVKVNTKTTQWDAKHKTRMAGVSSFGFSGTNAHAIVEEAPIVNEVVDDSKVDRKQHLLTLSAKNEKALKALAHKYVDYLNIEDNTDNLGDISYTSHIGRSHFNHRLSIVGNCKQQWIEQLDNYLNVTEAGKHQGVITNKSKKIAFLYTGQGSQYPDMCKELFETEQVFRESLLDSESLLLEKLEHTLTEVLYGKHQDKLSQTQYTQPALFAIEIALTELWKSWGVQPDYVMGHSLGEYVAVCERGVMTVEEGLKLVSERGRLMQELPNKGSMLSALGNEQTIIDIINKLEGLEISAFNAPGNLVVSGEKRLLDIAEDELIQAGVKCKSLNVAAAFHSALVEPMLDDFAKVLEEINLQPANKGFISNLTGHEVKAEVSQKNYWLKHIREAVNYRAGINSLVAAGVTTFIEIGPQPVLLGMARQSVDDDNARLLPSVRQNTNSHKVLMDALAELYISGTAINWMAVDQSYTRRKAQLPTYAFQRQRYWVAEQKNTPKRTQRNQGHPLLGEKVKLVHNSTDDMWFSQTICANNPSFLNDRKIIDQIIYPVSGYVEMALAAGQALFKADNLLIENIRLFTALFLNEDHEVQTLLKTVEAGQYEFEIYSQQSDDWVLHASGNIKAITGDILFEAESLEALRRRIIEPKSIDKLYTQYNNSGIDYGVAFQSIEELVFSEGETLARICLPLGEHQAKGGYCLHPALLDGAFQSLLADSFDESSDDIYVPIGIDSIQYFGPQLNNGWCHTVQQSVNDQDNELICNLTIFDDSGLVVVDIKGLKLHKISKYVYSSNKTQTLDDNFYHIEWQQQDTNNSIVDTDNGYFLICSKENKLASSVTNKINIVYENSVFINLNNDDALEKVIDNLSRDDSSCKGVLYLSEISDSSSLDALKRNSKQACFQLLKLVQTMLLQKLIPQLWIVTQQAQHIVKADQLEGIVNSQLSGMAKVIVLEHPELQCKQIDLDDNDAADCLYDELHKTSHENQIAYRDGKRYVARLLKLDTLGDVVLNMPKTQEAINVKENCCYLITGGLGGLGRLVAQWLIDKGAGHIVLVSRRKANKDAQLFIDNNQGRMSVVSCDIANNEQLNAMIKEVEKNHGKLKGIVHAAGVLSDGVIQQQDWNKYEAVFESKVWGTWNLHDSTKDKELDFFVLFSSMASMLGSPGQSNYAAANSYMDQFSAWRQAQGYPSLSINWGPWDEIGMAASSNTVNARIKSQGINLITPNDGIKMLDKLFNYKQANIAAIPFEWPVFIRNFDDDPFYENFYLEGNDSNNKSFIPKLNEFEVSERTTALTEFIVQQIAYVMGFSEQEYITESTGFFDLGMDSLMAVELRNVLQKYLSVSLSSTIAFDYPNVEKIVSYLKADVLDIDFGENDTNDIKLEKQTKNDELFTDLSKDELVDMLENELNELLSE